MTRLPMPLEFLIRKGTVLFKNSINIVIVYQWATDNVCCQYFITLLPMRRI